MVNEIYKVSWWGQGVYNAIYWGISYLYHYISNTYYSYKDRVIADGGTFENSMCLMEQTRKYN
jgi:hypothetical protein